MQLKAIKSGDKNCDVQTDINGRSQEHWITSFPYEQLSAVHHASGWFLCSFVTVSSAHFRTSLASGGEPISSARIVPKIFLSGRSFSSLRSVPNGSSSWQHRSSLIFRFMNLRTFDVSLRKSFLLDDDENRWNVKFTTHNKSYELECVNNCEVHINSDEKSLAPSEES